MDEGIIRIFNQGSFEGLRIQTIGKKILKYDTVGSTNDIAFEYALKGEQEGAVFWARSQTKGRGRLGRRWVSHKDKGLYFSIILTPDMIVKDTPKITFMAAVSIAKAMHKFCGKEFLIKWPNDIVSGDRKIGGILTEIDAEAQKVKFIVLGIGINTNLHLSELPVKEATSLKILTQKEVSSDILITLCLNELDAYYLDFKKGKTSKIIEEARALSSLWGKQVKIEDLAHAQRAPKSQWLSEGTAIDFNEDGALIIRQHNGFLKTIFAGDVRIIKE